jgi:hypothetical protein
VAFRVRNNKNLQFPKEINTDTNSQQRRTEKDVVHWNFNFPHYHWLWNSTTAITTQNTVTLEFQVLETFFFHVTTGGGTVPLLELLKTTTLLFGININMPEWRTTFSLHGDSRPHFLKVSMLRLYITIFCLLNFTFRDQPTHA